MIDYLLLLIGLIATLIAAITDIKTKEVPDWLSFSLISTALGVRLIYSLATNYWPYFLYALLVSAILFGVGLSMYYLKQWGGGDVKLLAALGALLGYFQKDGFMTIIIFIITLLISGSIWGITYSIVLAINNRKKFGNQAKKLLTRYKKIRQTIIALLILVLILLFIEFDKNMKLMFTITMVTLVIYFYIYILVKSVEDSCMYKKVSVNELREEDWLAEDIVLKNKTIKKSIPGLTKEHLALIKKDKIKFVKIKEGIPFIPSFFLAIVVTILISQIF